MECQICGLAPVIEGDIYNVYDIPCTICDVYYCGVCGMTPSHFPAICLERHFWQVNFGQRDALFTQIYNHMIADNVARSQMPNWRDVIGDDQYDNHQHIRFAVDEMWKVLGICTWARVASRYNVQMVNLLQSNQFLSMIAAHENLLNQFTASIADQPPMFQLGDARVGLSLAAYNFLSLMRSTRENMVVHYPAHLIQEQVNFNLNVDRALRMWVLNPLR